MSTNKIKAQGLAGGLSSEKADYCQMTGQQKLEAVAQLTDNVLAELTKAFFEVVKKERWGKRDLSRISGLNETGIGHILAGRRKNLTVESVALLARAMQKRPELVLYDLRPKGNNAPAALARLDRSADVPQTAAATLEEQQVARQSPGRALSAIRSNPQLLRELESAE
jgi:hypothetical protein